MKETKIKKVYRNICLTEWGVKETQEARKDIYNISNRIDDISSRIGDIEKKINCIYKNSNELVFRNRFIESSKNSDWLCIPLSLSAFSIGYDFAYILFMILDQIKPSSILELGLGQSTKIVNEYMKHKDSGLEHHIVEHNKKWIDFFSDNISLSNKSTIHCLNNELIDFKGANINSYKGFKKEFKGKKFDLILVDGPNGNEEKYSRIDILNILPDCLEKSFVILIDDINRIGETNTSIEVEKILMKNNIEFVSGRGFVGITDVYICTSTDLGFLLTI